MAAPGASVLVGGRRRTRAGRSLVYDAAGKADCCCGGPCTGCCGVDGHLGPCGMVECNGPWSIGGTYDLTLSGMSANATPCSGCPYTPLPNVVIADRQLTGTPTSLACTRGISTDPGNHFDRFEAPGTAPLCIGGSHKPELDLVELTHTITYRHRMGSLDPDAVREDAADCRVAFGPKTLTGQYRRVLCTFVVRGRWTNDSGIYSTWGEVAGRIYAAVNSAGVAHGHAQIDHSLTYASAFTFGSAAASLDGSFCAGRLLASASIECLLTEPPDLPGSFCTNPRAFKYGINLGVLLQGVTEC